MKQKIKSYYLLFLSVGLIFLLCGCKKVEEQRIQGTWKMANMALDAPAKDTYWIFEDGNLSIYNDHFSIDGDSTYGEYRIKMKNLFVPHLIISGGAHSFTGLWRIEKMNKKILIIQRISYMDKNNKQHPYLRREFTKE